MLAASFFSLLAPAVEISEQTYEPWFAWVPPVSGFIVGVGSLWILDLVLEKIMRSAAIRQQSSSSTSPTTAAAAAALNANPLPPSSSTQQSENPLVQSQSGPIEMQSFSTLAEMSEIPLSTNHSSPIHNNLGDNHTLCQRRNDTTEHIPTGSDNPDSMMQRVPDRDDNSSCSSSAGMPSADTPRDLVVIAAATSSRNSNNGISIEIPQSGSESHHVSTFVSFEPSIPPACSQSSLSDAPILAAPDSTSPADSTESDRIALASQTRLAALNQRRRTLLLMLAITVHNLPEGLVVGVAFGASVHPSEAAMAFRRAAALALGIGLQNVPEGVAISMPLRRDGQSKLRSFFWGQLSGVVEIIGGLLGSALVVVISTLLPFALSFASGAMVFVVICQLVPEISVSKRKSLSMLSFMIGFVLMMTLDLALG